MAELQEPVRLFTEIGTKGSQSLFAIMTDSSARRCLEIGARSEPHDLQELLGIWACRHGVAVPELLRTCICFIGSSLL